MSTTTTTTTTTTQEGATEMTSQQQQPCQHPAGHVHSWVARQGRDRVRVSVCRLCGSQLPTQVVGR